MNNILKDEFGISQNTIDLANSIESELSEKFSELEENAEYNQLKVLSAFQKHRISYAHFGETSGYGYDDLGRDALDRVYADIFHSEDAYVRHNIVSGTQAIALCLYGVLRPGDTLAAVTGSPYDTLEEVIGIRGEENSGSLRDFGVNFEVVPLKDGKVDHNNITSTLSAKKVKAVLIQRSKGYDWRDSLSIDEIERVIKTVKAVDKNIICIVDNCYGEFVEKREPTDVGADLVVGSLIKNIGGSLALSGGYIAGRADLIKLVSYRHTAPGLGRHTGASLGFNRNLYQGLYMAPHIVLQSLKTAVFCAAVFDKLGFEVCPSSKAQRTDIIQSVKFGNADDVIKFCQAIQKGSPIDSHVTPMPWDMPGYGDQVIMAAGAFVQGASIELSADAPICEPYVAYMQGGTVYAASKIAIMMAADAIGRAKA